MNKPNPKVEAFFRQATKWRDELKALRAILLGCPLTEDFKWRSPCYTVGKGNVATVWGMKESCALSFFKGVLLTDPEGILVAPGENSRSVRLIRFATVTEITAMEAVLKDYILEAIDLEKAGLKVDFPKDDLEPPEEFVKRLEEDPGLKAAFEALTPGRQRGYLIHFSRPKQSTTRIRRIERFAPGILEGKGLHDR